MPPSLSAYENQVNKFRQTGELLAETASAPTLLPCTTLFERPCIQGNKFAAFAYPGGILQFIGFYDNVLQIHQCLLSSPPFWRSIVECRELVKGGDNVVDGKPRGKLFLKFTVPDYGALRRVRRPGLALPYVW